jgi:hypothetical protein
MAVVTVDAAVLPNHVASGRAEAESGKILIA